MSTNTSEPTNSTTPSKSKKIPVIIALLSIIVIIQGVKIYLDYEDKQEKDDRIESTEAELTSTLTKLEDISIELDDKIAEIKKLGGDITELEEAKSEIEKERNQLRYTRTANKKVISSLKDKVDGYQELLKLKDEEIVRLKEINTELLSENTGLKVEKNELSSEISSLSIESEKLASKVAIASQLKAENIGILAISDSDKERESPFRNKHISKLKVTFSISENNVAPVEGKEILIRIIDSNGQVLFDVSNGSGTFMLNDKEEFYTASQEILFDNSKQTVTFLYDKGSDYALGQYTMEVYTEDYKMGTHSFVVK
ncbi:MAG: chromosome segregation protein SMC [Cyclobacteriaceae bacterium]|nr:chromosome segregation protein SMC [Cyclobacteriaceae bacterium]